MMNIENALKIHNAKPFKITTRDQSKSKTCNFEKVNDL